MNDNDRPIRQVLEAYRAAVHAKDADAFASLYAADVRIFDMWGRWSYDGLDAWRAMAKEWFGSLGTERVAVDFHDVQVTASAELAVAHGFVTFTGLSAEGVALRSLQSRHTWVLRQGDGGWTIVHEHSSGPADLETGKVVLRR